MSRSAPARKRKTIPVILRIEQLASLDAYAAVSGMSRGELVRRSLRLYFEELTVDEQDREKLENHAPFSGFWDEGCRSKALPPNLRYPLPPACRINRYPDDDD